MLFCRIQIISKVSTARFKCKTIPTVFNSLQKFNVNVNLYIQSFEELAPFYFHCQEKDDTIFSTNFSSHNVASDNA